MDDTAAEGAIETKPYETDENGVALEGEFPHNHRLRAEAIAAAGLTSDPAGIISDELIADNAARVKALAEAEAAERDLTGKRLDELVEIAERESVDLTGAKTNADRVKLINKARDAAAASSAETASSSGNTAGDGSSEEA